MLLSSAGMMQNILTAVITAHAAELDLMLQTVLTAVLSAAFGLAAFVAGQIIVKLFEPALDLRSLFGDIARDFIVDFGLGSGLAKDEKRSLVYLEHAGVIHQRTFRGGLVSHLSNSGTTTSEVGRA